MTVVIDLYLYKTQCIRSLEHRILIVKQKREGKVNIMDAQIDAQIS